MEYLDATNHFLPGKAAIKKLPVQMSNPFLSPFIYILTKSKKMPFVLQAHCTVHKCWRTRPFLCHNDSDTERPHDGGIELRTFLL